MCRGMSCTLEAYDTYLVCVLGQVKDVATTFLCQLAFDAKVSPWRLKVHNRWHIESCICISTGVSVAVYVYGWMTLRDDGALLGRMLA